VQQPHTSRCAASSAWLRIVPAGEGGMPELGMWWGQRQGRR